MTTKNKNKKYLVELYNSYFIGEDSEDWEDGWERIKIIGKANTLDEAKRLAHENFITDCLARIFEVDDDGNYIDEDVYTVYNPDKGTFGFFVAEKEIAIYLPYGTSISCIEDANLSISERESYAARLVYNRIISCIKPMDYVKDDVNISAEHKKSNTFIIKVEYQGYDLWFELHVLFARRNNVSIWCYTNDYNNLAGKKVIVGIDKESSKELLRESEIYNLFNRAFKFGIGSKEIGLIGGKLLENNDMFFKIVKVDK